MSRYYIRFISGKYEGGQFDLPEHGSVEIGRGGELDIVLVEDMVSRKHAMLENISGEIFVRDLGSTNGTTVNGERIKETIVQVNDKIGVGASVLLLCEHPQAISTPQSLSAQDEILELSDATESLPIEQFSENALRQQETSFVTQLSDLERHLSEEDSSVDLSIVAVSHLPIPNEGSFLTLETDLPQLLQQLFTSKVSGQLHLYEEENPKELFATIHISQGQLLDRALYENIFLNPKKQFFRLFHQNLAEFTWESNQNIIEEAVFMSDDSEHLLQDALFHANEFKKLSHILPEPEDRILPLRPMKNELSSLHEDELKIFQLVYNLGFFQSVLDQSPYSDLASAKAIKRLIDEEFIRF
jgi:hypothetical protein